MPRNSTPEAHEEFYEELMTDQTGVFTIKTEEGHPDLEFEVTGADKPTRNKMMRNMPSGLLESVDMPDDVSDAEEISEEDIDLSNVSMSDLTFSEEQTEVWLNAIKDHMSHDYYSPSEIRNIFNKVDDDVFISAGSYIIELGDSTGPVTGFRRE